MTGKLPSDPKTPVADPSPAEPAVQAVSPDTLTPDAASSAEEKSRPDPRATEHRVPELLKERSELRAERDRLQRELDAARQPKIDATPAASSAAPTGAKPTLQAFLDAQADGDFNAALEKHTEALTDWKLAQADAAKKQADIDRQRQAEIQRIQTDWTAKTTAAKAKHADFDTVALGPTRIPPGSLIDAFIWERPSGAEVLYHLQQHPADLDALLQTDPYTQFERLVLLGQRLTGVSEPDLDPPSTKAPPPPPTLRTRATPADPVERAIADDDMGAYIHAMNRKEIAARK